MTIKVGDRLPAGTLSEYIDVETEGCKIGPNQFQVGDLTTGKKVVLFGLPGAFTPTCSAQHVPSYVKHYDELKAKGVDNILCLSVNDAFVMGAWAKDQHAAGKVRMMGDGSAAYTKALGLGSIDCQRDGHTLPTRRAGRGRSGQGAEHRSAEQVLKCRARGPAQATGLKSTLAAAVIHGVDG